MNKVEIKFTEVAEKGRLDFIPNRFAMTMPTLDIIAFTMADKMLQGYDGGMWEYVVASVSVGEESVEVPFMIPPVDEEGQQVTLKNMFNGESVETDARLAGMILTSYAVLMAYEKTPEHQAGKLERLGKIHGRLRDLIYDYAQQTDQGRQAFVMMD